MIIIYCNHGISCILECMILITLMILSIDLIALSLIQYGVCLISISVSCLLKYIN